MKKVLFAVLFIFGLSLSATAQTSKTGRFEVGPTSALPVQCTPGDVYDATDSPFSILKCGPINTWSLQGGISGGVPGNLLVAVTNQTAGDSGIAATDVALKDTDNQFSSGQTFNDNINSNANFISRGPIPWVDITAYGARPVPLGYTTTGTISAMSSSLSLTSTAEFQNGDGISIYGAGATNTMSTPAAPTVTPSTTGSSTNTGISATSPAGGTAYHYKIRAIDGNGGVTAASAAGATTTGQSALGQKNATITSLAKAGPNVTVTMSAPTPIGVGSVVTIDGTSNDADFGGQFLVITLTDSTHFVYQMPLTATSESATGGTAHWYNENKVTWSAVTGAFQYAIYNSDTGNFIALSRPGELFFQDYGSPMSDNFPRPGWIPPTTASGATNDVLTTTVTAGGGTTTLTLANAAVNSASVVYTSFDDAPAILAAANDAVAGGADLFIPPSVPGNNQYVIASPLTLPEDPLIIHQEGRLWLDATVTIGLGVKWYGDMGNNQPIPSFQINGGAPIIVNTAYPGIYSGNFSSDILSGLYFTQFPGNNYALEVQFTGGSYSTIQNTSFLTGNNNTDDYMGIGLLLGDMVNDPFFMYLDTMSFTSGLAQTAYATTTPLFLDEAHNVTLNHSSFGRRGITISGNDPSTSIQINMAHIQGPIMPFLTTNAKLNDKLWLNNIVIDTSAQAAFADWGFTFNLSETAQFFNIEGIGGAPNAYVITGNPISHIIINGGGSTPGQVGQNHDYVINGYDIDQVVANSINVSGNVLFSGLSSGTPVKSLCLDGSGNVVPSTASSNCFGSGGGGGATLQVNNINNSSQSVLNLINSSAFNGLTLTFANPTGGNVQAGFSGTLGNAGLTNSATTVNSQTCTLGSTCTIPFLTNGSGNTSQAGINLLTSTANVSGLTDTPTNSATNSEKFEISGIVNNSHGGTGGDSSAATGISQVNAGTWSWSTALANGTTATTQTAADATTKVATDAFVSAATKVGTITVGTWQGTRIAAGFGGTGIDTSASTGIPQISSGTWSVSTALANGTTATTQSVADNTTKVATDAFVLANAATNPMTTLGDEIYGGAAGAFTRLAGPTGPNGVPQTVIEVPAAGAATAEVFALSGIPVNNNSETTCSGYTVNVLDRATAILCSGGSTATVTLPIHTATGFGSNFPFLVGNNNSGTMTLTPTTDTIDNGTLLSKWADFIYNNAAGSWQTVQVPQFAAFGTTCANIFTWSTSAGFGCTSSPNIGTATGTSLSLASAATVFNSSGVLTKYDGLTTASVGANVTLAVLDQTGVSTANSGTPQNVLASVPATGRYLIGFYIDQSAGCATVGPGTISAYLGWNDGTARDGSLFASTITPGTSATGPTSWGGQQIMVWLAAGQPVTFKATYTACTTGTWTYDVHAWVVAQ